LDLTNPVLTGLSAEIVISAQISELDASTAAHLTQGDSFTLPALAAQSLGLPAGAVVVAQAPMIITPPQAPPAPPTLPAPRTLGWIEALIGENVVTVAVATSIGAVLLVLVVAIAIRCRLRTRRLRTKSTATAIMQVHVPDPGLQLEPQVKSLVRKLSPNRLVDGSLTNRQYQSCTDVAQRPSVQYMSSHI